MSRFPFDVRALTEDDIPRISSLLERANEAARQYRGAEILESMAAAGGGRSSHGLIGTLDGEPQGILLWSEKDSIMTIEVLYVDPNSRNLGLGERLVNGAIAHARTAGMKRVLGRALPGDRETKNVFERTGLVSQVIVVGRSLD